MLPRRGDAVATPSALRRSLKSTSKKYWLNVSMRRDVNIEDCDWSVQNVVSGLAAFPSNSKQDTR